MPASGLLLQPRLPPVPPAATLFFPEKSFTPPVFSYYFFFSSFHGLCGQRASYTSLSILPAPHFSPCQESLPASSYNRGPPSSFPRERKGGEDEKYFCGGGSLVSADRLRSQHTLFLEVPTENDERFFWDVGRGVSSNRVGPHTLPEDDPPSLFFFFSGQRHIHHPIVWDGSVSLGLYSPIVPKRGDGGSNPIGGCQQWISTGGRQRSNQSFFPPPEISPSFGRTTTAHWSVISQTDQRQILLSATNFLEV